MCGVKQTEPETTMTTTILPTRNTEWGYFGTISRIETSPAADPRSPPAASPR